MKIMKGVIFGAIIALTLLGCSRQIDTEVLSQKMPDRPPVPFGLKIIRQSDGLLLSWQTSTVASLRLFRIYVSDSLEGPYRIWDSTSGVLYSKDIAGLTIGHDYYFKVASVVLGNLEGELSTAVLGRYGVISIMINNDDKYTRNRTVNLSFSVPLIATTVMISENADFSGALWQDFAETATKTLSTGDGVKRLYAKFQFADGSESDGDAVDSIILDTRAIIDSVYMITSGPDLAAGDELIFFMDCGESDGNATVSFGDVSGLRLFDDGTNGDLTSGDGVYSRRYTIPVNMEIVDGIIVGKFIDAAGNSAEEKIFPISLNIIRPPEAVPLLAIAQSSASVRLSWARSAADDFAGYYLYRDTVQSVSSHSPLLTVISAQGTISYTDAYLDENKTYYYIIYVHDNTGLISEGEIASATTLANEPPEAVTLAARAEDSLSILTWSINEDDDFAAYYVYRGQEPGFDATSGRLLTILNGSSTASFTDIRPDSATYYYRVYVYDRQGAAAGSNEISVP
jgi:fibronectin type 3 domain-containing protein